MRTEVTEWTEEAEREALDLSYLGPPCVDPSFKGYWCTRPKDHEGPHLAGGSEDVVKAWEGDGE